MKHWVFDLDGTLVDSLTTHFQVLEKVFEKFSVPFSSSLYHEIMKVNARTLPDYFALKFGAENVESALQVFAELSAQSFSSIQVFEGIPHLLQTLQSRNVKLAVWTARDFKGMTEILKSTGLESYFSICVSACCVSESKPHPEGLQKIASHFATTADEMVMVGDFDSDMLGAQAFGTKAVRVLWHPLVKDTSCDLSHWKFDRVEDLTSWVGKSAFSI